VDIEQIEIRLEYLLSGKAKTIRPDRQSMERTKQWVRDSLEQMKRLLENEEMNKPLVETFFTASPSAFACRSCNFREICPDKQ
jgi:CRISPR/Cas system-associated exonuclease Cas4 (RecB family)